MNSKDRCGTCGGSGLVPAKGCTCNGNAHTCIPAVCPVCHGTGEHRRLQIRLIETAASGAVCAGSNQEGRTKLGPGPGRHANSAGR